MMDGETRSRDSVTPAHPETASTIGSDELLRAFRSGCTLLESQVAEVNALNVFPVPDGDTGTNMLLTIKAALDEVGHRSYPAASAMAHVLAHGALMGARGNSGVIFSQILRGFARALDGKHTLTALDLALSFKEGAATAYKGVMKPVEGTILTVMREAAEAASRASSSGASIQEMLEATVAEAEASVQRTPSLLPVLAEAGVVDAGGQGLALILEGVLRCVKGETIALVESEVTVQHVHSPEGDYNYDTQFVIQGANLDLEAIRPKIAEMGDSVLVVGDAETIKVHVHSDHPGEVLEYGLTQGQVSAVIIENMQAQYLEYKESLARRAATPSAPTPARPPVIPIERTSDIASVAVVSGDGLRQVFESLGVSAIVAGGQTMNPSTQDLLKAIEDVATERVILLPNNSNIILSAQQAQALSGKEVAVIPTKTAPQGIAALLAFNYQAEMEDNVRLMTEASAQVQTVEITRAVRSVAINGLSIAEGQFLALLNGNLLTVAEDAHSVVRDLLKQIEIAEYEILTIYYGEDSSAEEAGTLAASIGRDYPDLEIEVLSGGQPHYHYIISAE